ncbi:hypothetical protein BZG36_02172 [Bifiguratus adelaidae]|uniref:Kinetochore protein Spc24 n=1 Tax=Bifiguratus adelaidae TaxID=1938954 RepID=A0A261Y0M5_9FUNG|nr:hypothetical protein BZG36_02172 [Bifiguratus adelaidae]
MSTVNAMQEPLKLIRACMGLFNASEDLETIAKVNKAVIEAEEIRTREQEESRNTLRALSRQLELAKGNATRPPDHPDENAHTQKINTLDLQKFSLAKNIREMEGEMVSLEAQISSLREESEQIDREQEAPDNLELDDKVIRLHIYRALGVELQITEESNFAEAKIASTAQNDVKTVSLDDKYSRFFYVNYLWDMIEPTH